MLPTLRSLVWSTDLIFIKHEGTVLRHGDYWVARVPSRPNFYWGNFLIFPQAPSEGDLSKWEKVFTKEFTDPKVTHRAFAWDAGEDGQLSQFEQAGYKVERYVGLTSTKESLRGPQKYNHDIEVRPLKSPEDWKEVIDVQVASSVNELLSKDQWRTFYANQSENYQSMIMKGLGLWFGAYLNDQLVGSLGIFADGKLGRFQTVSTHPDFQRRGICGTLVYEAAKFAFEQMKVETLVMVAFNNHHAAKIYESVGFRPTETVTCVVKV